MDLSKIDYREGMLYIQKEDGMDCIAEEITNEEEKAIIEAFKLKYPNGKPVVPVEPQPHIPTELELTQVKLVEATMQINELSTNLSILMDYVATI